MHSYWNRINTLLTFVGTVAAVLCILTSATDLLHKSDPKIDLALREVKRLARKGVNDQALVSMILDADLTSVFSWNVKQLFVFVQAEYTTKNNKLNQVVLWDQIVQRKEDAHIRVKTLRQKYAFQDQGAALRGRAINLTLTWNVMPKVGVLHTGSFSVPAGKLPDVYM